MAQLCTLYTVKIPTWKVDSQCRFYYAFNITISTLFDGRKLSFANYTKIYYKIVKNMDKCHLYLSIYYRKYWNYCRLTVIDPIFKAHFLSETVQKTLYIYYINITVDKAPLSSLNTNTQTILLHSYHFKILSYVKYNCVDARYQTNTANNYIGSIK